jgi:Peptidase_C39 like family
MKTRSSASVACCTALLIMTVPLMARAASKTLVLTDAEPQYASKLCWAAADVLAVNNFYQHCPTTPPSPPALFPTSQATEASYNMLGGASLSWYLSNICGPQIGNCNDWGVPPLHGLTFKWLTDSMGQYWPGTDSMGLKWDTITQEIEAGHPVLFMWNYPDDGNPNSPVGNHELVVIGYSDDTGVQQLQIWDPWPVADPLPIRVPPCGPASGQFTQNPSRSIDFSTYRNPMNDMGIAAVHDQDQWALAVAPDAPVLTVDESLPPAPPAPPPFHKRPQPPGALPQLSFARALSMALPQSRQLNLQVSGAAPRSLGVPFPIVGLGFVQLLRAGDDPTRLLAGTTSAILFPVESQGEVVDAFLMLFTKGRWQRGGYANIEITRRLVRVRATFAARQHLALDSFYMVSVPGEVAFFAAYGKGKQAILIPASTDPAIRAFAGVAVPAERQLKELTVAIKLDLQRHLERSRDSVRPNG